MSEEAEDVIFAEVSDFLDGSLQPPERTVVEQKIGNDPAYQRVHEEMVETRKALSGMQKARAPATFAADVTSTIHKRSAGRFFARRTFGDRVPFSALLVVAILGLAVIGYLLWASETGSLKPTPDRAPKAPITSP
ncbi:MAG: hypothetical protein ABI678_09220 [Kofleriaceae bacterium]